MNNINCFEDLKSLKSIPLDTAFEFDGEEWKNIPYPFYADRYLISDSGRSWSIKWHSFMRNHPNDKGYYGINLCKDSEQLPLPLSQIRQIIGKSWKSIILTRTQQTIALIISNGVPINRISAMETTTPIYQRQRKAIR